MATAKRARKRTMKTTTPTDSVPPHARRTCSDKQHQASPWRLVTSMDMKAEEVGKATPRTLTRISEWTNMDGAKYTLLVEWKTNIVAKVIATAILD